MTTSLKTSYLHHRARSRAHALFGPLADPDEELIGALHRSVVTYPDHKSARLPGILLVTSKATYFATDPIMLRVQHEAVASEQDNESVVVLVLRDDVPVLLAGPKDQPVTFVATSETVFVYHHNEKGEPSMEFDIEFRPEEMLHSSDTRRAIRNCLTACGATARALPSMGGYML